MPLVGVPTRPGVPVESDHTVPPRVKLQCNRMPYPTYRGKAGFNPCEHPFSLPARKRSPATRSILLAYRLASERVQMIFHSATGVPQTSAVSVVLRVREGERVRRKMVFELFGATGPYWWVRAHTGRPRHHDPEC